eukprot:1511662-Alexandrium_andersonii.AAC.1
MDATAQHAAVIGAWVDGVREMLSALEFVCSDLCQTCVPDRVALAVELVESVEGSAGHVARWIQFSNVAPDVMEGRFVTLDFRTNRVNYTMPTQKQFFSGQMSSGALVLLVPNTTIQMVRPRDMRQEMDRR